MYNELVNLEYLMLESNRIVSFNKNALIGLNDLETICLFDNPISLFQTLISNVCSFNVKCKVYSNQKC